MPDIGKLLGVDGTKEFMRKIHDKFGEYVGNTVFNAYKTEVTNALGTKANTSDLANYATNVALNNGLAGKLDTSASEDFLSKSYDKDKIINLFGSYGINGGTALIYRKSPLNIYNNYASEGFTNNQITTNIQLVANTWHQIELFAWGNSGNDGSTQDSFLMYSGPINVEQKFTNLGTTPFPALYVGRPIVSSSLLEKTQHVAPLMMCAYLYNGYLAFSALSNEKKQYGYFVNSGVIEPHIQSLKNVVVIIDGIGASITVNNPDVDYIKSHQWT